MAVDLITVKHWHTISTYRIFSFCIICSLESMHIFGISDIKKGAVSALFFSIYCRIASSFLQNRVNCNRSISWISIMWPTFRVQMFRLFFFPGNDLELRKPSSILLANVSPTYFLNPNAELETKFWILGKGLLLSCSKKNSNRLPSESLMEGITPPLKLPQNRCLTCLNCSQTKVIGLLFHQPLQHKLNLNRNLIFSWLFNWNF